LSRYTIIDQAFEKAISELWKFVLVFLSLVKKCFGQAGEFVWHLSYWMIGFLVIFVIPLLSFAGIMTFLLFFSWSTFIVSMGILLILLASMVALIFINFSSLPWAGAFKEFFGNRHKNQSATASGEATVETIINLKYSSGRKVIAALVFLGFYGFAAANFSGIVKWQLFNYIAFKIQYVILRFVFQDLMANQILNMLSFGAEFFGEAISIPPEAPKIISGFLVAIAIFTFFLVSTDKLTDLQDIKKKK